MRHIPGVVLVLSLTAAAPLLALPIPHPDASACVFPLTGILCSEAFTVQVAVRQDQGIPLEGSVVWVTFELVTGSVALPDPVEILTGEDGRAEPAFPEGLVGSGEIRMRVYADAILLATSEIYAVQTDCAVTTRPLTWSSLKRIWPSTP
jgi:hypothetical protein